MARLTSRQRAFISYYLECWNASEAARKAGYSAKTARQMGAENLSKPSIREEIDRRLKALAISADEVLARLQAQATASMAEFVNVNQETGQPAIDLREAQKADKLHVLKKISITDKGLTIELYDAQGALQLLGKYHGLFTDKIEHSGTVKTQDVTYTDGQRADLIAALVERARKRDPGPDTGE